MAFAGWTWGREQLVPGWEVVSLILNRYENSSSFACSNTYALHGCSNLIVTLLSVNFYNASITIKFWLKTLLLFLVPRPELILAELSSPSPVGFVWGHTWCWTVVISIFKLKLIWPHQMFLIVKTYHTHKNIKRFCTYPETVLEYSGLKRSFLAF